MRLDKFLSEMSVGTRSEVKQYIKKGRVKVNENVAKDPGMHVDAEKDEVFFDGVQIGYSEFEYYMLNKPVGVVSATTDKNEKTVIDLIESNRKDLFPVGRLDKDTVGLLLITNDGELSHNLLSPKKHVDKTYYVEVDKELSDDDVKTMEEGIDIGDEKPTLPCRLNKIDTSKYEITIREGRYHQIKRMFEHFGATVTFLKRLSMGPLVLDDSLEYGDYRPLTENEVELLNK